VHEDCDDWYRLCWVGVCFSDFGHDAVCVDKDPSKIEILEACKVPIYEFGLDALMEKMLPLVICYSQGIWQKLLLKQSLSLSVHQLNLLANHREPKRL
jgi:hypothetical protein